MDKLHRTVDFQADSAINHAAPTTIENILRSALGARFYSDGRPNWRQGRNDSPAKISAEAAHERKWSRQSVPFYYRSGGVDPRLVRLVRNWIETRADAERYRSTNLGLLRRGGGFPQLVRQIFGCDDGAPCQLPLCPQCARRYRLWFAAQILSLAPPSIEAHVVTVFLGAVSGGSLYTVSVRQQLERLRKRLIRCGIRAAIGGTEASYNAAKDWWVVHVHLLVFGEIKGAIRWLKAVAKKDGFERPVKCQPLRDRVAQISYLQKFTTFHRPGKAGSAGRGRAYPLKPRQVAELARWYEDGRFGEFAFLLGFRRRGSRIVAEPSIADLLACRSPGGVATWRRTQTGHVGHQFDPESLSVQCCLSSSRPTTKTDTRHNEFDSNHANRNDKSPSESTAQHERRQHSVATRRRRQRRQRASAA